MTTTEKNNYQEMPRSKVRRLVQAIQNHLVQPDQRIKFQSGTVYQKTSAGNLIRVHPIKPWRNKRERKQHLKARRAARATYGHHETSPAQAH